MVHITFIVQNTGNAPLVFSPAEIECSCTSADIPSKPVLPGATDSVIVHFNTAVVYGRQDRTLLLKTNDLTSRNKLRFKGVVLNK